MKKLMTGSFFLLFFLILNFQPLTLVAAYGQGPPWNADARVSMFYNELLPYGNWIHHEKYGWCWYPYNVPVDWRPYSNGHWEYTNDDWTWVSDYPWGWACFHYGRWFYDAAYGWLWWPDTVWAPAWVVWRTGGDWIGWAPYPPEAVWNWDTGIWFTIAAVDDYIPRYYYSFVRRRYFHYRHLRRHIALPARNATIWSDTRRTTNNLRIVNRRIVNYLPVQPQLEKELGHSIKRRRLVHTGSPVRNPVQGNQVRLYRPDLRAGRPTRGVERRSVERPTAGRPAAVPGARPSGGTSVRRQPSVGSEKPSGISDFTGKPSVGPKTGPVETPLIVPSTPGERARTAPPRLRNRQRREMRQLDRYHSIQHNKLNVEQSRERKSPPAGIPPAQLEQRHSAEQGAFREQMRRERGTLQNWHSNEKRIMTAPNVPPQRRFEFPAARGGARGQVRQLQRGR